MLRKMSIENSKIIIASMLDQCKNDHELIELKDDLLLRAVRYARIRVDWYFSNLDDRKEPDQSRSGRS